MFLNSPERNTKTLGFKQFAHLFRRPRALSVVLQNFYNVLVNFASNHFHFQTFEGRPDHFVLLVSPVSSTRPLAVNQRPTLEEIGVGDPI